ncbi:PucR family transcriptional regulator [Nocardia otitidiscaviarum]|uniref:PucR family transcriptional regulator n=1 Tax=Nocardia otitidiscaviarum TaxID=1823 RepID=UPI001894EE8B|nr:helix-turn-helix domain-containing protein [Nocardia otitidiscaviarum]MBF6179509.1 helix-turn-helix domain-containing protein [Nocardia otitidiscaviarum]
MSAGSQSIGAAHYSESVLAARTRIVTRLFDHVHDMADIGVAAIMGRIPAYAARDETFHADVHDQLAQLCRIGLGALLENRKVTPGDIAYTRRAAARRARSGLALVDYINAFRLGQQALWKSLMDYAGDSEDDREAALSMVVPLNRYCDLISTQAANAYLEFQRYQSENGHESRELLETLLSGTLPDRGPQLSLAHGFGIGVDAAAPLVVLTAAMLDPHDTDSDATQLTASSLARVGVNGLRTLSGPYRNDVVAIAALGRGSTDELCARLRATHDKLRTAGIRLAVGVSPLVTRIADLPRAHQESRSALELLPEDGGVMALPHLTPFRYLVLRADDTARHLVDPRIATLLAEDRSRGGVLAATIRAFAAADMNLREAAEALCIHPNTAKYRLGRIQEQTGRNPRGVGDLIDLLVAIELQDPLRRDEVPR